MLESAIGRLALIVGAVTSNTVAVAQTTSEPATPLREVAVTATRVAEPVQDIPATISVIDAQQIDRGLVQNIKDLVRYEPGVSVNNDPNRFGAAGFNIRGLGANRVIIQMDGVRAPNYFQFGIGPFNTSNRNFVDLDSVKTVEILRGPASTTYGSDALGGVVSYLSKDPLDYLDLSASPYYASVKSAYASANEGWQNTATFAVGNKEVQALVLYTHYDGHQTKNMGDDATTSPARTEPNPATTSQNNWLTKLVVTPDNGSTWRAIYENYANQSSIDVLSLNESTPTTSSITGDDDAKRYRYSIDYEYRNPDRGWFSDFKASFYQQRANTTSKSEEYRTATSLTCSGVSPGASTCYLPREFTFSQRITGATAQLESLLASDSTAQRILSGMEVFGTYTSTLRNALRYNLTAGTVSNTIAGDTFPVRDFPNTDSLQFGAYAQDEIYLIGGRLVITPAIRYDYYRLNVYPDSIYLGNTPPGVAASDFSDNAISPKIAALYKLTESVNVYGQYAYGFRAPPFDDVNAAFRNPVQSYVLIPNPGLVSETSRGLEVGVKGDTGRARYAVALYYNRYRNFIDSRTQLDCPADPLCVPGFAITFQSVNRASVRIYGAEAKGEYLLSDRWSLAGSIAYANGEDLTLGVPLNSVNPLTAVGGLRYAAAAGAYGGSLNITGVQRKTQVASVGGVAPFVTPGFATVDLLAYWNLGKYATINAGVFNLFNRTYWLWNDVSAAALPADAPGLARYTQPGINASASLILRF